MAWAESRSRGESGGREDVVVFLTDIASLYTGSGQIDRSQLVLRSIPIEKRIFALAERHLDSSHREVRNLATALFEHNERLFTFLDHEGVEPTNNSAERALRTAVQWR